MSEPGTTIIKVVICDDHVLYRAGVKTGLSAKKDVKVVCEADNGMHLLNLMQMIAVDVVLLDIQMPIMDGIATLPEIKKAFPHVRILMLTMMDDHAMITKMMELGANSYLTKTSDTEIIYEAIKTCFYEEYYFNTLTNKALLSNLKRRTTPLPQKMALEEARLGEKEIAILRLMCEEKSSKEIAEIVDLSPRTVEAIRDKLKVKTGAKSTAGLIMYAVKNKLIYDEDYGEPSVHKEEKIYNLSEGEMLKLFVLSTAILEYVNHELAGHRNALYITVTQLQADIKKQTGISNKFRSKIDVLLVKALNALLKIGLIKEVIKSHFYWYSQNKVTDSDKLFISKPFELIETIKKKYSDVLISVDKRVKRSLQIIYPPQILLAIFSELVENSKKSSNGKVEILVNWTVEDGKFHFELHDDGPGFAFISNGENVKVDSQYKPIYDQDKGLGLRIIDKTLKDSGGYLVLGQSDVKKGAKVFVEIPLIDFKYLFSVKRKLKTLSMKQLKYLFSLSTSILVYVHHDLLGEKIILGNVFSEIQECVNSKLLLVNEYERIGKAIEAINKIDSIGKLIKSHYFHSRTSNASDFRKLFISVIVDIVDIVRERYSGVAIDMYSVGYEKLEIVYPPQIMLAILAELTENAKKSSITSLKIAVKWQIKGKVFHCEFHDNGPGFPELECAQSVSLNSIAHLTKGKASGMGLSIIHKTIYDSNGQLLFSRSEELGGAKVHFNFPVIDYNPK